MSAPGDVASGRAQEEGAPIGEWWPILLGWAALYVPTYYSLSTSLWREEDNAHGPVVLAVSLWLLWQRRSAFAAPAADLKVATGSLVFFVGLASYVIGRSQHVWLFEVGSQLPVLTGLLLILRGKTAVKMLWFPIAYLVFMLPLPDFLVGALTGPLKEAISSLVENICYALGYPIARTGVVLTIGSYQLLVADACSGLNSMFSLTAMGLLYIYVMRHAAWRSLLLLAAVWPIAFIANVARVLILVLVTYHLGDEAGQGFLHGFASIALFATALLLLIGLDRLLGLALRGRQAPGAGT